MPIDWKDSMSVHVGAIDAQHQTWLKLLSELYDGLNDPKLHVIVKKVIEELQNYIGYHFAFEEKYFDLFEYEFADEHKQQHRMMRAKFDELVAQHAVENVAVVGELLYFMEDWLLTHIEKHDKKYTKCFNDHGLNGVVK